MKHWKTALAIWATLSASLALAEDFKTIDGKEYKNAKVSRVEPDGIVLLTKSGISKVYFTELPKEVQERYHYEPAKAAEFSAAAAAADAQAKAAATAVAQQQQEQQRQQQQQQRENYKITQAQKYRIQGYVSQKANDGLVVRLNTAYDNPKWQELHIEADRAAGIRTPQGGLNVFLKGHPNQEQLADGDRVDVVGSESGVHSDGATTYHSYTFYSN